MPGVSRKTWTPFFRQESDSLIDTHLSETQEDRVSSRRLKADLKADKVAPSTWKLIVRAALGKQVSPPKKDHMGNCLDWWKLEGQSLVRVSAEVFGFHDEVA